MQETFFLSTSLYIYSQCAREGFKYDSSVLLITAHAIPGRHGGTIKLSRGQRKSGWKSPAGGVRTSEADLHDSATHFSISLTGTTCW